MITFIAHINENQTRGRPVQRLSAEQKRVTYASRETEQTSFSVSRFTSYKMRRILFLILLYVCEFNSQPCEDKNSIDISDGILKDGKIFKNGLAFPPKYVYKKNFNGVNETRGCVCDVKNCLRKCCPMGSVIYGRNCTQMTDKDIIMNEGLDIFFMNAFQRRIKFDKFEDLFLVYGRPCKSVYKEDDGPWFVQKVNYRLFNFIYLDVRGLKIV